MVDRMPLLTAAAVCTICAFELYCGLHRILAARQTSSHPKSYGDGVTDGYAMARAELKRVAESCSKDSMPREEHKLELAPEVFQEGAAVRVAGLPRWTLRLLGDKYVVRGSLRAEADRAWFLTERDSSRMDHMLAELLKEEGARYASMSPADRELAKREGVAGAMLSMMSVDERAKMNRSI